MVLKKNKSYYTCLYLQKFINNFVKNGKKHKIENIFFKIFSFFKYYFFVEPPFICLFFLEELKLVIELKSLRLGSLVYKIPNPIVKKNQMFKTLKFFVTYFITLKEKKSFFIKLCKELLLVLKKKSVVLSHNQNIYKIASNNRAFAHFRW